MVLKILGATINTFWPSKFYVHAVVAVLVIVGVHAFAQGRRTNRERDLHARVFLVTGGFTSLGLVLLQNLAERGAHIIALSPKPINDPEIDILVSLLRSGSKNDQIYAEECDFTSSTSVRSFCTRFLTGKETRLDAIVFAHEYQHIGSVFSREDPIELSRCRQVASLATFLMLTLLLPVMLVAPVERDIRIVSVVNPFYAAAAAGYSPLHMPDGTWSTLQQEGWRALQMATLTRHLQRVLDALPSGGQLPRTDESTVRVVSNKAQKSNIVAVSVCPGISRLDTISPLLNAGGARGWSLCGLVLYVLLQPLLRILTKSSTSAIQSVLHVLLLPTPFKKTTQTSDANTSSFNKGPSQEVLRPGALYRECAIVNVQIPTPGGMTPGHGDHKDAMADGEFGGVTIGQSVWEAFEAGLRDWEKTTTASEARRTGGDTPSSEIPHE